MAAALGAMVASMSRGKKAYAQHEAQLSEAIAHLTTLREELKSAVDADAESYNSVMKAYKEAKAASNGDQLVTEALKGATNVPFNVAQMSNEVADWIERLRPITNPNMASDLTVGTALARAAVEGALANVEINLASLTDQAFVTEMRKRFAGLRKS